ncbi:D12 class N6 adenine-specific DNA methyltransferase [Gimesia chilikensis]|uniref:site-specific DNA-methyltransferase (adenine-specific) n=1 Tax=Gimesia chilikensis TaxID=2605989 RepID=A0A517WCX1_9PLAN|nr:DNA adenine methylase [Gimesia chilikensis]QDU03107.1 D12 class N6 adenine-specific DNA methyltransferase [Gimesia chilikensis]
MAMLIKSLAPWFGCKRTLAPQIIPELGIHDAFGDFACGSCALPLAKKICGSQNILNDLHGDLINLARVVASDQWVILYRRLVRTFMHDELFQEAKEQAPGDYYDPAPAVNQVGPEHIDRAYWYFILSWMGMNGFGGTHRHNQSIAARYTANGGSGAKRFDSARRSIEDWHLKLSQYQIRNVDCFELLDRLEDSRKWALYCDPPYFQKGDKYIHDFTELDHNRLAESLRRFKKTRIVLSYYDDPRLEELYPGWTKVKLTMTKFLVNQGMRDQDAGCHKAPEVLMINGESYTQARSLF